MSEGSIESNIRRCEGENWLQRVKKKKRNKNDMRAARLIMLAFAGGLSIGFMHRSLIRAIIVADLFTSVAESTHTWAAQASATHTDTQF